MLDLFLNVFKLGLPRKQGELGTRKGPAPREGGRALGGGGRGQSEWVRWTSRVPSPSGSSSLRRTAAGKGGYPTVTTV